MERKYKLGDTVVVNIGNEIMDAKVFAHINLQLGKKAAYSLQVGKHFFFVEEQDIIEKK
jgi:hypothetical protein